MSKILAVIEGEPITVNNDGTVSFKCKLAVDGDGSGASHGDPDFQPDTSLHERGMALNADTEKYFVVPPAILDGVKPVVLGCHGNAINVNTHMESDFVVGDVGPKRKLGEGSIALCKALGISDSPTTGGEEEHVIHVQIWPGVPAIVDGMQYDLEPS